VFAGVGKHGARYARHIRDDLADVELVAIARRDPDQAAAAARVFGARAFTDYRELIERGEVDAVIVVVPPTLHVEVVSCAAQAGIPVLLEKPAAPSLAAGQTLLAALRRNPIPLMVAQTLRYNAVVCALRAACADLGPLRSLTFAQRFEPSPLGWLDDPARSGGGIVLHTGVHAFDLARVLRGLMIDGHLSTQAVHTAGPRTTSSHAASAAARRWRRFRVRTAGARNGHRASGERGTLVEIMSSTVPTRWSARRWANRDQ
jgi:predicted dehydrogenase